MMCSPVPTVMTILKVMKVWSLSGTEPIQVLVWMVIP
ncbi:hypothetical protein ES703_07508 [subsurface metagenome]